MLQIYLVTSAWLEQWLKLCLVYYWFLIKAKPVRELLSFIWQIFDKVRDMGGDWRSKIVPVTGDIAEENLGLSDEDWEMLQEDVQITFHSAATVRFDEDLRWVFVKWQSCQRSSKICRIYTSLEYKLTIKKCQNNDKFVQVVSKLTVFQLYQAWNSKKILKVELVTFSTLCRSS